MANYLVTGSNRGIGLELCKQLKTRGENVIATCRNSSEQLDRLGVRVEEKIDVTSNQSIQLLKKRLDNLKIDVLIQNAAIAKNNNLDNLDPESIRHQFEVNALSPLCFVKIMLENLKEGSKVILISSRMGSIEDNTSGGSYGYRMSKAALCMAGKSLSIDLQQYGISVAILHPGLVSTRMTSFTPNGISPTESVEGLLRRVDSLDIKNSGKFWHSNGEKLPW